MTSLSHYTSPTRETARLACLRAAHAYLDACAARRPAVETERLYAEYAAARNAFALTR